MLGLLGATKVMLYIELVLGFSLYLLFYIFFTMAYLLSNSQGAWRNVPVFT
jgi:hypothetical protein